MTCKTEYSEETKSVSLNTLLYLKDFFKNRIYLCAYFLHHTHLPIFSEVEKALREYKSHSAAILEVKCKSEIFFCSSKEFLKNGYEDHLSVVILSCI